MISYLISNPVTVATFLSAVAAIFSAFSTWQGPRSAARLAEEIRRNSERDNERRRMKLQVFATLMQERATIASIQSVQMLNSIDFVFSDAPKVREAWADLYSLFNTSGVPHQQLREDKLRKLLKEMGSDIGLADTLRLDDISRIYYPNALAQQEELESLQREVALRSLRANGGATQVPAVDTKTRFPPKPARF